MKRIRRQQDSAVEAFVIPDDRDETRASKQVRTSFRRCRQVDGSASTPHAFGRKARRRSSRYFANANIVSATGCSQGIVSDDEGDFGEDENSKLQPFSTYTQSACYVKRSTDDGGLKPSTQWSGHKEESCSSPGYPLLSPPQFPNVPAGFVFS